MRETRTVLLIGEQDHEILHEKVTLNYNTVK